MGFVVEVDVVCIPGSAVGAVDVDMGEGVGAEVGGHLSASEAQSFLPIGIAQISSYAFCAAPSRVETVVYLRRTLPSKVIKEGPSRVKALSSLSTRV